ncbi:4-(cytidine 5'-diphospho)-2-C-methyl-D-erythritol kinase [Sphingomonas canadensis]|uniref:4-diphosphocytidyl-2-C-methyl-D-erythritol kinase n=1 Tax=Sphingomonas canadensis TaxID=1219257 RepID=A0ABW3H6P1_9SPHN|nr:4-(cytidine 5'-diphospho)-2-C-methyl-D-erythritol kinase [Sphingomonas canadensis]MCW3836710.1 4-(cytidine 5'-diphospho)-2-C-methyl-D-erythritol kinase [Sphingomonas canadensis]
MIVERARAKLNLALHVRARRPDGYHELETLFAFVEHGDEIRVARADAPSFTIDGRFCKALRAEDDNLITRAAAAFAADIGGGPWAIGLGKWLPVASGIGGGSADAAATLRALAELEGVAPDDPRLFAIAERLGSDVPACLLGRTALGRGRGEVLELVAGAPGMPALLVNPGVAVSTAEVFRRWDGVDRGPLGAGPLLDVARAGRNDLAAPAIAIAPVIGEVLAALEGSGAALVRMSGSGATCFALYDDDAAAEAADRRVRKAGPGWWRALTRLTG